MEKYFSWGKVIKLTIVLYLFNYISESVQPNAPFYTKEIDLLATNVAVWLSSVAFSLIYFQFIDKRKGLVNELDAELERVKALGRKYFEEGKTIQDKYFNAVERFKGVYKERLSLLTELRETETILEEKYNELNSVEKLVNDLEEKVKARENAIASLKVEVDEIPAKCKEAALAYKEYMAISSGLGNVRNEDKRKEKEARKAKILKQFPYFEEN